MTSSINNGTNQETGYGHYDGLVILFLSFSVLIACVIRVITSQVLKNKVPIPFTVLLLILGFIIGISIGNRIPTNDFLLSESQLSYINPHLLFYIFLPLLIFDSAFNCNFNVIRHQIIPGILLAGPGVLVSVIIVALCAVYIFPYNWNWLEGVMFGSILSATDPVAIVALLHESGAGKALAAIIDMESLLNDGSAFVIFMIFRDIVVKNATNAKKIISDVFKFTLGGPAFGLGCGILAVITLNLINNDIEVEIIATFGLSYLVFYVADFEIGVSAVLALVVMGLFMAKHKYCISSHVQAPIASFWGIIVYFANILIFIITGLILGHSVIGTQSHISGQDFGYSIVLYIAIHLARFLTIILLYPFIKLSGAKFSWKEYIILFWSGLRGSMSVILALIVKSESSISEETRNRMLFQICMMALFTLTINGTSCKFLVHLLGLDHGTPVSEAILLRALEHMRFETAELIATMKHEKQFTEVDWDMLNEYLPEKIVREFDEKRNSTHHRCMSVSSGSSVLEDKHNLILPEIEALEASNIFDTETMSDISNAERKHSFNRDFILPVLNARLEDIDKHISIRNELMERFLSALYFDYESQWYLGMIRRRTLYILNASIEKARHRHSLKVHWDSVVEHFRLPFLLKILRRFDSISFFKKQFDRFLFDHIFLVTELILAFHLACKRMDNIKVRFPELEKIDENIWRKVCQETVFYQQTAAYILLDLQRSYRRCWRVQITKRCAQMILKCESDAVSQLHETGVLGESEHKHMLSLIEKKLFNLEFYRVRLPKGETKAIVNSFSSLGLFQSLPIEEYTKWNHIFKSQSRWLQPRETLTAYGQTIGKAFMIARGIVESDSDTLPIYFRSGTIVAIDLLFMKNSTSRANFIAIGGLVEVYEIDVRILDQLLADDHLASNIYREIASQILLNEYQTVINLSRSQIKALLSSKAVFHQHQTLTLQLNEGDHLLILRGNVDYIQAEETVSLSSIRLQRVNTKAKIVFGKSTVLFTWSADDELWCITNYNRNIPSSQRTHSSIHSELVYPGHFNSKFNSLDSTTIIEQRF